jgi:hypothetical protein
MEAISRWLSAILEGVKGKRRGADGVGGIITDGGFMAIRSGSPLRKRKNTPAFLLTFF